MATDITKLDLNASGVSGHADEGTGLSLSKAPQSQLRRADELINEGATSKPSFWDRRSRQEHGRGMAHLVREKFATIETQMRGIHEQCQIVTQTASESTRIAAETLLNQLHQAAAVQCQEAANAAYERVLALGIERLEYILSQEKRLPMMLVESELKRCAKEMEQNLQAIDARVNERTIPREVPEATK